MKLILIYLKLITMDEYKEYTVNDLYLDPINAPFTPYYELREEDKINLHWGQRKLLLTLLQFINIFWDPTKVPKPKFVYAGAAPGTNISIVSMLYPEIEFHLYDPSPFKIKASDKIHLHQEYFTDDIAREWSGRDDVYFASDIRTLSMTKNQDLDDHEKIIVDNMNMQMNWYNIIKPVFGQLKFRLPFEGGNRPKKLNYLYGYIFKQPWATKISIETRLVPLPEKGLVSWDTAKYQNQMFYHNTMIRSKVKYLNVIDKTTNPIDDPELLNDWDSMTEAMIIASYLSKRTGTYTLEQVKSISRLFTTKINEDLRHKNSLENRRAHAQKTREYRGRYNSPNKRYGYNTPSPNKRNYNKPSPNKRYNNKTSPNKTRDFSNIKRN